MTRYEWLVDQLQRPIDPNPCLLWPYGRGGYSSDGIECDYGYVKVEGKQCSVHRVAWKLWHGELPSKPLEVRHKCGVGHCFNPHHLLSGTHSENELDKRDHGTGKQGERHHAARLTADQVRAIRASDLPYPELAHQFGVDRGHIANIKRGSTWKHLLNG